LTKPARRQRRPEPRQERLALDAYRPRVRARRLVANPGPANYLLRHDRLKADAQPLLLGDPIRVAGHEPEHAFGASVAARKRRALLRCATGAHENAGARRVEDGLNPVKAGLHVGLPRRSKV